MITVYGIKTKTDNDIFLDNARPDAIVKMVKGHLDDILGSMERVITKVSLEPTLTFTGLEAKLIPISVLERYMIYSNNFKSLVRVKGIITNANKDFVKKGLLAQVVKFQDFIQDYLDSKPLDYDDELSLILIEDNTGNVKDVCVGTYAQIMKKVGDGTEYVCSECGKSIITNEIPEDFYYKLEGPTSVKYFCDKCKKHKKYVSHVGDFSQKPLQ